MAAKMCTGGVPFRTWARRCQLGAFLGLWWLAGAGATATEPPLRTRTLTVAEGLSHDTLYGVVQDRTGFIWLGTEAGLDRFDGHSFRHFGRTTSGADGLSSEDVSSLTVDRDGALWIGLWGGGLDRLDPDREVFTHFRHDEAEPASLCDDRIYSVFEDSARRLWVATFNGLCQLDRSSGRFIRFRHDPADPASLAHERVWCVVEDRDGTLWVGSEAGLDRFEPARGVVRNYRHRREDASSLGHDRVRTLLVDRSGTLWVGTQSGLDRYDPARDAFVRVEGSLGASPGSEDGVTTLFEDHHGDLWVGTQHRGLHRLRHGSEAPELPEGPGLAITHEVEALLEDTSGMLWVATRGEGARVVDLQPPLFARLGHDPADPTSLPHGTVQAVLVARDGGLWVGTQDGLSRFGPSAGAVRHYRHDPADPRSLASSSVTALAEDPSGQLWIGTDDGLDRLDADGRSFAHRRQGEAGTTGLSDNRVVVLLVDRNGGLWVGAQNGLDRVDLATGAVTSFTGEPNGQLADPYVRALCQDREGALWVGTEVGGLDRLDPTTGRVTHHRHDPGDPTSLSDDRVFSVYEDATGILWIGTGHGLDRLDRATGRFSGLYSEDGLPSDTVASVLGDSQGRLWMATNGGITRYNPSSGALRSYGVDDGLQGLFFSRGAGFRDREGRIYFGGLAGLNSFSPERSRESDLTPRVVLTSFSVFNQPWLTSTPLHKLDRIDLSHRQNTFTFEFSALEFSAPDRVSYAYRLEGSEPGWTLSAGRRDVRYTNVPPGSYLFQVKATNRDGVWSQEPLSIALHIAPPFWQRWWFRLLGLALVVAAVGSWHTTRLRRIQRQKHTLEELVRERTRELRQLNEKKNEFLGIAAHDLRSPLAGVTGTTDLLLHLLDTDRRDPAVWRRFLGNIRATSEQMRSLVDDLLDVASIEAGRLELRLERVPVAELLAASADLHGGRAAAKGIDLQVATVEPEVEVVVDRLRIGQALDNLVANAVKFTNAGGSVRVWCETTESEVVIRVQDSGQGLPPEEVSQLFTGRKLSARPTAGEPSTGLGLVIVRKVLELHGGRLWAESEKGVGSTFSFTLPRAAPSSAPAEGRVALPGAHGPTQPMSSR